MLRRDPDHIADPIMLAWDAVADGQTAPPHDSDTGMLQFIRGVHALDDAPMPDAAFLNRLESELIGKQPRINAKEVDGHTANAAWPPRNAGGGEREQPSRLVRLLIDNLAIAAILAIILGGLAVTFVSERSEPESGEPIPAVLDSRDQSSADSGAPGALTFASSLDITITPSDLGAVDPSAWETAKFIDVRIAPGSEFSTDVPYFSCCDGVAVFQVRQDTLDLTVDGQADIYRAGSSTAERAEPGVPLVLEPGDAVALAMQTPATFTNASQEDELSLTHAQAFQHDPLLGDGIPPVGYRKRSHTVDTEFEPPASSSIDLAFESIDLAPGQLIHFEIDPAQRVLGWYPEPDSMVRILEGTHDEIPENDRGSFLVRTFITRIYDPGPYTLYNSSETATTLYLMRMAPAAAQSAATPEATPAAATPVAALEPQPIESLLNIQVNPAELDALPSDTWNGFEFELVSVKSGESFTTDHIWFNCCPGMLVFQVRQGSASIVVDGPADLYTAGSGQAPVRIPAATLFALESGQTVVFAMENPAIVTNTGSDDLVMLGGFGYRLERSTNTRPDGYDDLAIAWNHSMDPIPAELLDVSFEQVTLEPGELTHIEYRDEEWLAGWVPETNTVVRMMPGIHDAIPEDNQSSSTARAFVMDISAPGPYTFFNPGDNPATLHLMRVSPAAAQPPATPEATPGATPVAVLQPQPLESFLNIQVSPADLDAVTPDQWERLEFTLVTVKTGESFTTDHPYFTCCPGMVVFHVLEGAASFLVDGPTDLYAAGSGQNATRIPTGSLFPLEVDQTAVFAGESPAIVTNTGTADLVMLGGYGFDYTEIPGGWGQPPGYTGQPVLIDYDMDPLPSNTLDVSFERIMLQPGERAHLEADPEERLVGWYPEVNTTVRMASGELDALPEDPFAHFLVQSFVMHDYPPGPYTFFNVGKNPATLHLMRIVPVTSPEPAASPAAATPNGSEETSASAQPLSLLVADPDALPIGDPETRLELAYLEAGEHAGESAPFEGHMIATNTGATLARFLHGGVYAADPLTGTSETTYGFFAGPRITTSFAHDPSDSMQSVNIDRATIEPGQPVPLTIADNDAFMLLADDGASLTITYPGGGEIPSLVGIDGSGLLNSDGLDPGAYELENAGPEPVTVYTLRVGPDLAPPTP